MDIVINCFIDILFIVSIVRNIWQPMTNINYFNIFIRISNRIMKKFNNQKT